MSSNHGAAPGRRTRCKLCERRAALKRYHRDDHNKRRRDRARKGPHRRGGLRLPSEPFRDWLLTLGSTPEAIAELAGLSPKTVREVLAGKATVTEDLVDSACMAMGVSINTLYPPDGP